MCSTWSALTTATAPPTFCIRSKAEPTARPYAAQSVAGSARFADVADAAEDAEATQGSDPAATAEALKPCRTVRRDRPSAMVGSSAGASADRR